MENNNLKSVCANCEFSYQGYAESSLNYGLRCSLKDDRVYENDTCVGFKLHSSYLVKKLEEENFKLKEIIKDQENLLKYVDSPKNEDEWIECCKIVEDFLKSKVKKDKINE